MLFGVLSVLGVMRSKNNFAALHCVGVSNVLLPPLCLIAVLVAVGVGQSAVYMLVLAFILLVGGPIVSHAIALAEYRRKPR